MLWGYSPVSASFPTVGFLTYGICNLHFLHLGVRPVILRVCREDDHKKLLAQVNVWQNAQKTTPRVFCGIYTHQPNHETKLKVSQL